LPLPRRVVPPLQNGARKLLLLAIPKIFSTLETLGFFSLLPWDESFRKRALPLVDFLYFRRRSSRSHRTLLPFPCLNCSDSSAGSG